MGDRLFWSLWLRFHQSDTGIHCHHTTIAAKVVPRDGYSNIGHLCSPPCANLSQRRINPVQPACVPATAPFRNLRSVGPQSCPNAPVLKLPNAVRKLLSDFVAFLKFDKNPQRISCEMIEKTSPVPVDCLFNGHLSSPPFASSRDFTIDPTSFHLSLPSPTWSYSCEPVKINGAPCRPDFNRNERAISRKKSCLWQVAARAGETQHVVITKAEKVAAGERARISFCSSGYHPMRLARVPFRRRERRTLDRQVQGQ